MHILTNGPIAAQTSASTSNLATTINGGSSINNKSSTALTSNGLSSLINPAPPTSNVLVNGGQYASSNINGNHHIIPIRNAAG